MKNIFKGFWVYLLAIATLCFLGTLIQYRRKFPTSSFNNLIIEQSQFAFLTNDPCSKAIYGDPVIDDRIDSWIKMNIYCSDNTSSTNSLRYNALGQGPGLLDVLTLISKINNFSYLYHQDRNTLDIGNLKTNNENQWSIYINKKLIRVPLNTVIVNKKDNIDLIFE